MSKQFEGTKEMLIDLKNKILEEINQYLNDVFQDQQIKKAIQNV